jgi:hypothetical protein
MRNKHAGRTTIGQPYLVRLSSYNLAEIETLVDSAGRFAPTSTRSALSSKRHDKSLSRIWIPLALSKVNLPLSESLEAHRQPLVR